MIKNSDHCKNRWDNELCNDLECDECNNWEEEDSTKYENWHYQVYAAKERYEKDIKRYEEKIREFFEGHADMIEFDVDQDVVKVRGKYEHPIPPRLIMDFCDKFGYYMPTLNQDWINTSIFTHVHYRFSKKDCRISKEV